MSYAPFPLVWGAFGGAGPASPSFGIIQTDFGTYPTATGASDILTIVSADSGKYFFTGTALTDTVTLTITGFVSHEELEEYLDEFDTRITDAENDAQAALSIANTLEPRVETLETDVSDIEVNYRYTLRKQRFVLTAGDIAAGYVNLTYVAASESLHGYVDRLPVFDGDDFTTQVITTMFGDYTRITFIGPLLPSGSTPLQVGDVVHFLYAQKVQDP